jgi:hypothetical protein
MWIVISVIISTLALLIVLNFQIHDLSRISTAAEGYLWQTFAGLSSPSGGKQFPVNLLRK